MGVLNVTPDSFYDGGKYLDPGAARDQAILLRDQGADILDVGGESSRPFSEPVSEEEELRRVLPVISEAVRLTNRDGAPMPVSVDTYRAGVAARALEAGAMIVNDISACAYDPGLLDVLAQYRPGYVLMHSLGRPEEMQRDPRYGDVVREIMEFFEHNLNRLTEAGLPEKNIVLDPGIGFGKLLEHNLAILKHIEAFQALGRPVLLGLSNKSLWGGLLGLAPSERGNATQAATAVAAAKGVLIHRVHDVAHTLETLTVARHIA